MRGKNLRNINSNNEELSPEQRQELLRALQARFEKNMNRHKGLEWARVQAKLEANTDKLWSLNEMERTGGEPDVVGHDKKAGEYIFYDSSAESPKGRRSVCYDREALVTESTCSSSTVVLLPRMHSSTSIVARNAGA